MSPLESVDDVRRVLRDVLDEALGALAEIQRSVDADLQDPEKEHGLVELCRDVELARECTQLAASDLKRLKPRAEGAHETTKKRRA